MARNKSITQYSRGSSPDLLIPHSEAEVQLRAQIEKGRQLKARPISTNEEREYVERETKKWVDYTRELLLRMFDSSAHGDTYDPSYPRPFFTPTTFRENVESLHQFIQNGITPIESLLERLELIPISPRLQECDVLDTESEVPNGGGVFIVHGRDNEAKETVARFIGSLGISPVILHEQPNQGRTIIEKLEAVSASVGFAIILITPDDTGGLAGFSEAKPRARQNVVFELGFFIGKLGRNRVCALYESGVELPTDVDGLVYVLFDPHGGWKLPLAREIKAAGIDIDIAKLI